MIRTLVAILILFSINFCKSFESKTKKDLKNSPRKILFIGDSLVISFLWGFDKEFNQKNSILAENYGKVSSSLVYPKFYDWHKNLKDFLAKKKYDYAIIMIGANDDKGILDGNNFFSFKTEAWVKVYRELVRELIKILLDNQIKVFWVSLPPMGGSKKFQENMQFINRIAYSVYLEEDIEFIHSEEVLGNEVGEFTTYKILNGKKIPLRQEDRIHLLVPAAKLLTEFIFQKILESESKTN
ncbi:MAG: DUF459 domain-containing protein [Leptospiraceae bacterium]|nr:DUF459 domain-containing protein [Leptospiraceae bacterium]